MNTVAASIPVLRWAARRAHLDDESLTARFRKWPMWLRGEAQPTLRQLEEFARLTHTAIGYFFLPQPPELKLPVPDFRTLRDAASALPAPSSPAPWKASPRFRMPSACWVCASRRPSLRPRANWG